jgi:hypothetical protein
VRRPGAEEDALTAGAIQPARTLAFSPNTPTTMSTTHTIFNVVNGSSNQPATTLNRR